MPKDVFIDKSKVNFITIGRMCEQKNSLFIVKIIKELKNLNDNIHLFWVGNGPLRENILKEIKKNKLDDHITILNNRRDVPQLLSNMDYMIMPSKWEGLPVSLVESQASGLPCFISDNITDEVDLGLCTKISLNNNEKDWAQKINNYIINGTYNNKIDEGNLFKFDIKNVAMEISKIYCK